jgi:DNA-binding beta-propeller fold protein YncE
MGDWKNARDSADLVSSGRIWVHLWLIHLQRSDVMRIDVVRCCMAGLTLFCGGLVAAQEPVVGPAPGGGMTVTTTQLIRPAGETIEFAGKPVDLVLSPDGKTVYVKANHGILVIDESSWKITQELTFTKVGGSMCGIVVTRDGKRIYASTATTQVYEAIRAEDGKLTWARKFDLPGPSNEGKGRGSGDSFPCGLALTADGKSLLVCMSRNNTLGVVKLESGKLTAEIPVGVAPYAVVVSQDGKSAYVTNWGGRRVAEGEPSAKTAGTPALIDKRGVAASGTVSVVDLEAKKETGFAEVGLQPNGICWDAKKGEYLIVAANSDWVARFDPETSAVVGKLNVRPEESLPFGSMPNGVAAAEAAVFVSNAGNNAIAMYQRSASGEIGTRPTGFIPTGWYPGPIAVRGKNIYVASIKGVGSRTDKGQGQKWMAGWYRGTVSKLAIPDEAELKAYTGRVMAEARVPQVLKCLEKAANPGEPVPIPARPGQKSLFEHVLYVIKENRTYDQVFGDMGKGNSEPSLCMYGREVTPNIHAIADQFVLLDNFYCNGVISCDGHSWATEGNSTPYLERSYGGFNRSYTFGDDPLTYSASGFVWDHILAAGYSFRNYGEFDYGGVTPGAGYVEVYEDFVGKGGKYKLTHSINTENVKRFSHPDYPGWCLEIPDVLRADIFLKELAEFEKSGTMPNFMTMYLPNDHTNGTGAGHPTPRAYVADNDLALGRVVEALSHSKFWPTLCIFVVEDDPQDGFDHVDGHRSPCLVISPYTKRGQVVSKFYSQASVVHSMELIFGCVPANQTYAMAPIMTDCFVDKPDVTPFKSLPNRVPLGEMPGRAGQTEQGRDLAALSTTLDFSKPDMAREDALNRILWQDAKGDVPYPSEWAGAHGRGLETLGLKLAGSNGGPVPDDDDD